MMVEYATQSELDAVRADIRAVWSSVKDLRDDMGGLKGDIREIKALLTERCAHREASMARSVMLLEESSQAYQRAHSVIHADCKVWCHDAEKRLASLERSRVWMLGAAAAIGAFVGVGSWAFSTWLQHFGGTT